MRIISGATWRQHQQHEDQLARARQQLTEAKEAAEGHASDAAILREHVAELHEANTEAQNLLSEARLERDALRSVVNDVVAALVTGEDAEAARREAARLLVRHSESADLVLLAQPPKVHLYVRHGEVVSAHATQEGAMRAAEADGAPPSGWEPTRTGFPEEFWPPMAEYQARSVPVLGEWPDRTRVHVLFVDDRPYGAAGTAENAQEWAETHRVVRGGLVVVTEWSVAADRNSPAAV